MENAKLIEAKELVQIGKIGRVVGLKGRLCFWLSSDFAEFLSRCVEGGEKVCVKRANPLKSSAIKSNDFKVLGALDLGVLDSKALDSKVLDSSGLEIAFENLKIRAFSKQNDKFFIEFFGVDSAESAKNYVNAKVYATKAQTRAHCELKKDEFFYFDIVGLEIVENGENLGIVRDIERIGNVDYLVVEARESTAKTLVINAIKPNAKSSADISIESKKTPKTPTNDSLKNPKNNKNLKKLAKKTKPKTFLLPYIDRFVLEVSLQKGAIFTQNAKDILEQS